MSADRCRRRENSWSMAKAPRASCAGWLRGCMTCETRLATMPSCSLICETSQSFARCHSTRRRFRRKPIEIGSTNKFMRLIRFCGLLIAKNMTRHLATFLSNLTTMVPPRSSTFVSHLSERAKGHGPVLIEKASRFVFSQFEVSRIIVQIKKGTPGSQMAFLKAGYQPIAPTVVNGHTALQMMLAPKMIDDAASSSQQRLKSA